MYTTITPNKIGGCSNFINYLDKEKSITHDFANYLDKENKLIDEPDYFFNGREDEIDKFAVINGIDNNCKGLSKDESRFFSLTINPSESEIKHIQNLATNEALKISASGIDTNIDKIQEQIAKDLLKEYSKQCMDNYARNFGREDKGLNDNKGLVWYGKVEKERYWKYKSPEVQHNNKIFSRIRKIEKGKTEFSQKDIDRINKLKSQLIKESDVRKGGKDEAIRNMMPKSGNNYHIHIIVSRRDKDQKLKLSPLAKARKNEEHKVGDKICRIGFDREEFKKLNENSFDKTFDYKRSWAETYEASKLRRDDPEKYKEVLKEKLYWENFYKVQPTRQYSEEKNIDNPLIPTKDTVNKVTQGAGLKYIQEVKPYVQVVNTAIKGISVIRENRQMNTVVRRKAINNYQLLNKNTQNIAQNILAQGVSNINLHNLNPYVAVIKAINTSIQLVTQNQEINR